MLISHICCCLYYDVCIYFIFYVITIDTQAVWLLVLLFKYYESTTGHYSNGSKILYDEFIYFKILDENDLWIIIFLCWFFFYLLMKEQFVRFVDWNLTHTKKFSFFFFYLPQSLSRAAHSTATPKLYTELKILLLLHINARTHTTRNVEFFFASSSLLELEKIFF